MLPPIVPEDNEPELIVPPEWAPRVWTGGFTGREPAVERNGRTYYGQSIVESGPYTTTLVSDGAGHITWGSPTSDSNPPRPSLALDGALRRVIQTVPEHPGLVTDMLWAAVINPGGSSAGKSIKDKWGSSRIIGYEPAGGGAPQTVYDDWLYGQVHRSAEHHEGLYNLVVTHLSSESITQTEMGMKLLVDGGYQVAVLSTDFLVMSSLNRRRPPKEVYLIDRDLAMRVYIAVWVKGWTGDTLLKWIDQE